MSIKLKSVKKSLNNKEVLSGISLDIKDGDFVVFDGKNTETKTALLDILSGVDLNFSGQLTISGYDILDMVRSERVDFFQNTVSYVDRSFYLQPELSIAENISLPGFFAGFSKVSIKNRLNMLEKKYVMSDLFKSKANDITEEKLIRIIFLRAVFMNPKIIIIDLPGMISKTGIALLLKLLVDFHKDREHIVIVSTSNSDIKKVATKVFNIKTGVILDSEEKK